MLHIIDPTGVKCLIPFMDSKDSLGLALKKMRRNAGLSQVEVAQHFGYTSSQFISNWERGICSPPVKCLKKLASLYKVSDEKLFKMVLTSIGEQLRSEFLAEEKTFKG